MKLWLRLAAVVCFAATTATMMTAATWARADGYPSKPITIIVPASPGGVTDMLARILAKHFIADWKAEVVVENKPGANNQVAAEYVTHQPGDGYTLFVGPETTFVVNPTIYAHLLYDPVNGFTPIVGLASIYHGLILNPSVPANNVKELIALGKAKPGQLNYGTYGVGSSGHLNMEEFNTAAGVNFVPVHYKGAAPAMQDVIAGHIQMMFISAIEGRHGEVHRAGRAQAHGALARRAGDRRDAPRLHRGVVVRVVRTGRRAARRGRQDQRRGTQDFRRSRGEEELPRCAIFRIARRHARGAARAAAHRRAEMAQDHPDRAYHGGVIHTDSESVDQSDCLMRYLHEKPPDQQKSKNKAR